MSASQKRIIWPVALSIIIGVSVFLLFQTRAAFSRHGSRPTAIIAQTTPAKTSSRNLSLQPEAFNLGRISGKRFAADKREQSIALGVLTQGTSRQNVQITRSQRDDGERVAITLAGSATILTWDKDNGPLASGARAVGSNRDVLEKLVWDSPDQFVLSQLRGASYRIVTRNLRPDNADDSYAGPLWNVLRVEDPERDAAKRPQSAARLYFINTRTGLIDRIVSEVNGEKTEATFVWSDQAGEKVTAQITWRRQDQVVMSFQLTSFSHLAQ